MLTTCFATAQTLGRSDSVRVFFITEILHVRLRLMSSRYSRYTCSRNDSQNVMQR